MLQVQQQHLDKESKRHSLTSFSRLYIQMKESISFIVLEHVCLTRIKRCFNIYRVRVTSQLRLSPLTIDQSVSVAVAVAVVVVVVVVVAVAVSEYTD